MLDDAAQPGEAADQHHEGEGADDRASPLDGWDRPPEGQADAQQQAREIPRVAVRLPAAIRAPAAGDHRHEPRHGEGALQQPTFERRAQEANRSAWAAAFAPSIASSLSLVLTPPPAERAPGLPPAAVTRWQGTTIGQGFLPSAWPTSRASSLSP